MILIIGIMQDNERLSFVVYANRNNFADKRIIQLNETLNRKTTFNEIAMMDYEKRLDAADPLKRTVSFRPPHDARTRARLGNMYESDPNVKRIIKFYTSYVMGTKIKRRITPIQTDTPPKKEDLDDLIHKIISKAEREKFDKFLAIVDERSEIFPNVRKIYQQSFPYGTGVLWKALSNDVIKTPESNIEIPIGTPILLKPINGYQLGRIHQDATNFQPKFYEYGNNEVTIGKLKAKDGTSYDELIYRKDLDPMVQNDNGPVLMPFDRLIVFDRENPGVTPDTYYYGMSPLLPLIYHSENIRRIDQKILPELNETQYAPVGIFKVDKESSYNLDELAAQLSVANNKIVINDDITYEEVKMNSNLEQIIHEKETLQDDLLMGVGMPASIFKSEKMVNRSTAEITVNIFQSVSLDDERDLINKIMWKYWYRDLMGKFFDEKEHLDLELKIELEFPNRTFTPFVDKAASFQEAYLNGGISLSEWRRGIDHPAVAEEPLKIPESADQKSNFGNQMGGNPNPDGSGTPTKAPVTKNNQKQGGVKPPSGNQNLQGNQNTVKQARAKKKVAKPKG